MQVLITLPCFYRWKACESLNDVLAFSLQLAVIKVVVST